MTYEDELKVFIKRTERERHEIWDKMRNVKLGSPEMGRLNRKFLLLCRRHDEEFIKLNAKYNLPLPKVIDNSKED